MRQTVRATRSRIAGLRIDATGYGSTALRRAERAVAERDQVVGAGPRAAYRRARVGTWPLAWYRWHLPTVEVRLTGSPAGRMIAEHLQIRREEDGRLRFRQAQSVLHLPGSVAEHLRGRHRQAVRTNVNHARSAGLFVVSSTEINWTPGSVDTRLAHISPGPVEKWTAYDEAGGVAGDAVLSVDSQVALLHGLVSFAPYARWLIHTSIVERLCGECRLLMVNSDDVYRTNGGVQHFQRLLGYEIATLRVRGPRLPEPRYRALRGNAPAWPSVSNARSS